MNSDYPSQVTFDLGQVKKIGLVARWTSEIGLSGLVSQYESICISLVKGNFQTETFSKL